MQDKLTELRNKATHCLGETRISDGEADINKILLDLSETDEQDLDIKFKTLQTIIDYLQCKSKLRLLNSDLSYFQKLSLDLKNDYDKTISILKSSNNTDLEKILNIIKNNY